jgi:cytochrome P450
LQFISYSLAKYPSFKERLEKEVNEHIKSVETMTTYDINKLQYLPAFLKEVQRVYGPAQNIFNR